jgi:hypothetical protein
MNARPCDTVTQQLAVPSTAIEEGVGLVGGPGGIIGRDMDLGKGEMCVEFGDETFQIRFDLVPFLFLFLFCS